MTIKFKITSVATKAILLLNKKAFNLTDKKFMYLPLRYLKGESLDNDSPFKVMLFPGNYKVTVYNFHAMCDNS